MTASARVSRGVAVFGAVALAIGAAATACALDKGGLGQIFAMQDSGVPPADVVSMVDACSLDLRSDPKNCGQCGNACPAAAHQTATCVASTCGAQCAPGFTDCNGNPADGCETATGTDPKNCGACGHDCGGGACMGNFCAPTALAAGQQGPVGLVIDDTYVFWTVRGAAANTGELMRAKLDGSSQTVMASGLASPAQLSQTPTTLFWANEGSAASGYTDGSVAWMAKDQTCPGAATCPFVVVTVAGMRPTDPYIAQPLAAMPAIDGAHVAAVAAPNIILWSRSDGAANSLYGVGGTSNLVAGLALGSDGGVYVTSLAGVARVDVFANGAVTMLADAAAPLGIALDDAGAYAYVAMNGGGTLEAIALDGGGATSFASSIDHPAYVALDGDTVYFTAQGTSGMSNGYVGKVGKDGTCPTAWGSACPVILANGQGLPGALAVDASYVYWVDTEGGTVLKVTK
jgi:hypothetical protein